MKVTDHVKGMSTFQFYRQGSLIFKTDTGIEFPVPVADVEETTVDATMKSLHLMKWVARQLKIMNAGPVPVGVPLTELRDEMRATAAGVNLCDDEGCDHAGTPHVCNTVDQKRRDDVMAAFLAHVPDPNAEPTELMKRMQAEGDANHARMRVEKVKKKAQEIFVLHNVAAEFMIRPHAMLDDKTPWMVAAESQEGADKVIEILGRGAYGGGA